VSNGRQQGPVDDAGLNELMAEKVITDDTLMWKEGQPAWAPLRELRPARTAASPVLDHEGTCMVCNRAVGADNLIELIGTRVCEACKPKAVQAMREGVAVTGVITVWRDGKRMIACDNARFPQRCLKCNGTTKGPPLELKLQLNKVVRRQATIYVYLCAKHKLWRRCLIIGAWSCVVLGIVALFTSEAANSTTIWDPFLLLIAATLGAIAKATTVRTLRIEDNKVWLAGAGKEFLASLPQWTGIGR
jgi:ribosomal protein L36